MTNPIRDEPDPDQWLLDPEDLARLYDRARRAGQVQATGDPRSGGLSAETGSGGIQIHLGQRPGFWFQVTGRPDPALEYPAWYYTGRELQGDNDPDTTLGGGVISETELDVEGLSPNLAGAEIDFDETADPDGPDGQLRHPFVEVNRNPGVPIGGIYWAELSDTGEAWLFSYAKQLVPAIILSQDETYLASNPKWVEVTLNGDSVSIQPGARTGKIANSINSLMGPGSVFIPDAVTFPHGKSLLTLTPTSPSDGDEFMVTITGGAFDALAASYTAGSGDTVSDVCDGLVTAMTSIFPGITWSTDGTVVHGDPGDYTYYDVVPAVIPGSDSSTATLTYSNPWPLCSWGAVVFLWPDTPQGFPPDPPEAWHFSYTPQMPVDLAPWVPVGGGNNMTSVFIGTSGNSFDHTSPLAIPISAVSNNGGAVQLTTTVPHGLTTGDLVFLSPNSASNGLGSVDDLPSGAYTVTADDSTNFTIAGSTYSSGYLDPYAACTKAANLRVPFIHEIQLWGPLGSSTDYEVHGFDAGPSFQSFEKLQVISKSSSPIKIIHNSASAGNGLPIMCPNGSDVIIGPDQGAYFTLSAAGDYWIMVTTPPPQWVTEAPTGAIDGMNTTFTLSQTPTPPGSLQLFLIVPTPIVTPADPLSDIAVPFVDYNINTGTWIIPRDDITTNFQVSTIPITRLLNLTGEYTLSGNTITMVTPPPTGATLQAYYAY